MPFFQHLNEESMLVNHILLFIPFLIAFDLEMTFFTNPRCRVTQRGVRLFRYSFISPYHMACQYGENLATACCLGDLVLWPQTPATISSNEEGLNSKMHLFISMSQGYRRKRKKDKFDMWANLIHPKRQQKTAVVFKAMLWEEKLSFYCSTHI